MSEEPKKKGMSTGVKFLIGCGGCLGVLVVGGIALSALGLFGAAKVAEEIDNQMQEQEQAEEEKKNNPHAKDESVEVDSIVWKVISAEDKGSTLKSTYSFGDDCVSTSGKYVQVRATVTNNTNDMQSLGGLNIYDSEGREFTATSDVITCVEDEFYIIDNINPGITTEFIQTFEVPTDASGFILKVTDLQLFNDNHEYIDLGL